MKKTSLLAAGLATAVLIGSAVPGFASAEDDNDLLDLLVCKKIITKKEAEALQKERAERAKKREKSSAEKIVITSPVKELKLYGDTRMRFQYDNVDPQVGKWNSTTHTYGDDPGHGDQRDRWRFRLRMEADFKLSDDWFGGVQLQLNRSSDSSNQTFDGGFQNYPIYVSRAFVGWNATDWLTLIAGKQPNPFYTTDLVWDPDINPSGLVENFKIHKLFSCGEQQTVEYANDGKTVLSVKCDPLPCPWTLSLVAGQFIFDDNQEYSSAGYNTDAYLFVEQLIFTYEFTKDIKLTVAPAYLTYNSAQINNVWNQQGFAQTINDTGSDLLPEGWGETRDLSIIQLPGDLSFTLCKQKIKLYWDGAYNTDGAKRENDIYVVPDYDSKGNIVDYDHVRTHSAKDDFAWLVGLQLGDNIKKGDWSILVNYRQVGLASIDPNLNDSDWALSRLNMKGWKASLTYNFTDAVTGSLTGSTADNLRKDLVGGQTTRGAKLADANSVQVLQVDLNVKF
ncbi:MAG: putative porin [Chthoniobacteraceae bacterium]